MEKADLGDFPWEEISKAKKLSMKPKGLVSYTAEIGETTQARRGLGDLLLEHMCTSLLQWVAQKVFFISSCNKDWKKKKDICMCNP